MKEADSITQEHNLISKQIDNFYPRAIFALRKIPQYLEAAEESKRKGLEGIHFEMGKKIYTVYVSEEEAGIVFQMRRDSKEKGFEELIMRKFNSGSNIIYNCSLKDGTMAASLKNSIETFGAAKIFIESI